MNTLSLLSIILSVAIIPSTFAQLQQWTCTLPSQTVAAGATVIFCNPNTVVSSSIYVAATIQSSFASPSATFSLTTTASIAPYTSTGNGLQGIIFASTLSAPVSSIKFVNNNSYPMTINGTAIYYTAPATTTAAPTTANPITTLQPTFFKNNAGVLYATGRTTILIMVLVAVILL